MIKAPEAESQGPFVTKQASKERTLMSNTTPSPDQLGRAIKAVEVIAKSLTIIASSVSMISHAYAYNRGWSPNDVKSHEEVVQGGVQK